MKRAVLATYLISLDSKVCIGKEQGDFVNRFIDTEKMQFQVDILRTGIATTNKNNKIILFKTTKTVEMKSSVQVASRNEVVCASG